MPPDPSSPGQLNESAIALLVMLALTESVDLSELIEDLVAKPRGLGDRDWQHDGAPVARLDMDQQRITQAVLQLAHNAVKHTREGDEIAIGFDVTGGLVRIWVRDTGPGVPPADRARIFERFGRSAVPENDEGFGLGLSIVRANAAGHARSCPASSCSTTSGASTSTPAPTPSTSTSAPCARSSVPAPSPPSGACATASPGEVPARDQSASGVTPNNS